MTRLRFRWLGREVVVHTSDAGLVARLARIFGPLLASREKLPGRVGTAWRGWIVTRVNGRARRFPTLDDAVVELVDAIDETLRPRGTLVFHAAAVGDVRGLVVIVGASGAGKTSTAIELARRGYRYLADEWVVFDAEGALRPYPRAAALRATTPMVPGAEVVEAHAAWGYRRFVRPADTAGLSALRPASIQFVFPVPPQVEPGPGRRPVVERIEAGAAAARLIPSTCGFVDRSRALWPLVGDLAVAARAFVFRWTEPGDIEALVAELQGAGR